MHENFDKLNFYFPQDRRLQLEARVKQLGTSISERVRFLLLMDLKNSEQSNDVTTIG